MDLPNATATLTPKVAASDYVYFQRDLTDTTGRRRSIDQSTNAFARDWRGDVFQDGVLYCFCASSPTVGDDALIGFFTATGQAVAYTGQPISDPASLSTIEQQLLAPAGTKLPKPLRFGRAMALDPDFNSFSGDFPDFA